MIISLLPIYNRQYASIFKVFLIFIVHSLFFGIENKLNPFGIPQLNTLNYITNLLTLMTIFGGLFLKVFSVLGNPFSFYITIVIICLNIYFMWVFLKFFIQMRLSFGDKISKMFSCLNKYYKPLGIFSIFIIKVYLLRS